MNEDNHVFAGPGSLLRAARESAGVSLRDISAQLHLDEHTVESLERDDFKNLPAPTFVRGYLRGYARLLSVPVGPVMEAYDREGFRPPDLVADISEEPENNAADFPVSLVTWVVALVLGAMVIVWWNNNTPEFDDLLGPTAIDDVATNEALGIDNAATDTRDEASMPMAEQRPAASDRGQAPDTASAAPEPPPLPTVPTDSGTESVTGRLPDSPVTQLESGAGNDALRTDEVLAQARDALAQSRQAIDSSTAPSTAQAPEQTSAPSSPDQAADEQHSETAQAAPAAAQENVPADSAPQAPRNEDTPAPAQPIADGQTRLQLKFSAESWVEVYDRDDKKLFYNLAKPGQEADLRGAAPLRVLLGRARGVDVRLNEKPFDVTPFVERGVARFTVP